MDRLAGYCCSGLLAFLALTCPATRLWILIPLLVAAPAFLFPDEGGDE